MRRSTKHLVGIAAAIALSGCAASRTENVLVDNCVPGAKQKVGIVTLSIDPTTGLPTATPPDCYVSGGGKVIFRTTRGARTNFTVVFDKGDGTPAISGQRDFTGDPGDLSNPGERRGFSKSTGTLIPSKPNQRQEFRYSIVIDGRKADPSIIIDM